MAVVNLFLASTWDRDGGLGPGPDRTIYGKDGLAVVHLLLADTWNRDRGHPLPRQDNRGLRRFERGKVRYYRIVDLCLVI